MAKTLEEIARNFSIQHTRNYLKSKGLSEEEIERIIHQLYPLLYEGFGKKYIEGYIKSLAKEVVK